MGFFSNILGISNSSSSLQEEANKSMLKMLQERLAVATCPTERQQLQDNIKRLQNGSQPLNYPSPSSVPNSALFGEQPPPPDLVFTKPPKPPLNFSNLENEISNLKLALIRVENEIRNLKSQ